VTHKISSTDNLRLEYNYVTGWYGGGFTNQFMGLMDLIMISTLTPFHIPIVPPFVSQPHLPMRAGYRAASDIFDLERWARAVNKEMVEWKDVKDLRALKRDPKRDVDFPADEEDEMACWSIWAIGQLKEKSYYKGTPLPVHLNLGTFLFLLSVSFIKSSLFQIYHTHLHLSTLGSIPMDKTGTLMSHSMHLQILPQRLLRALSCTHCQRHFLVLATIERPNRTRTSSATTLFIG
jgi:hypothetical protein